MKTKVATSSLTSSILVWSLVGFPAIAAVTSNLGVPSTELSMVVRGLVAVAAVAVICKAKSYRLNLIVLSFLFFWLTYFLKLTFEFGILSNTYSRESIVFWVWSVGACFLPAFAVAVGAKNLNLWQLYLPLLVVIVPSMALLIISGDTNHTGASGAVSDIGRLNVDSLNPISMGHLGASGILVGIGSIIESRNTPRVNHLCKASILLGLMLMVLANSRGPIVAILAALLFLISARIDRRRTLLLAASLAFLLLGLGIYFWEELQFLAFRFGAAIGGQDLSTIGRMDALSGAWSQFLSAPFFGDALEERSTQFYPHNVIVESFMATGLLGGMAFLFVLVRAVMVSWSSLRNGSLPQWVGLLTVQYIVGAQFSGAIYQSTAMWALVMLVSVSVVYGNKYILTASDVVYER